MSAVELRCTKGSFPPGTPRAPADGFMITRAVERALFLRGPALIAGDTVVTPTLPVG